MDLLEKKAFETTGMSLVRHPWELARERIIKKVIADNFKQGVSPAILDVGCGDGYIISSISNRFTDGTFLGVDIELSSDDLSQMNAAAPKNLSFYKDLAHADEAAQSINGFTLMDVLEHVPDDVFLLNQLTSLHKIQNDSLFFITVPAWQFLFTDHDVFLKHYRRYTRATLSTTIRNAALHELEVHYFFFSLFLMRFLKSSLLKALNKKEEIVTTDLLWKHGAAASKFVANVLYLEYLGMRFLSKLGIHLPGLSVFGLCKKVK